MPKRSDNIPPERRVTLVDNADGSWFAVQPLRRRRFLLDDGTTVDVIATHDDSDLRVAILEKFSGRTIAGSTVVATVTEEVTDATP